MSLHTEHSHNFLCYRFVLISSVSHPYFLICGLGASRFARRGRAIPARLKRDYRAA